MDQNQRRARIIGMRQGKPLPRTRTAQPGQTTVSYFIQSRPAPSQPWRKPAGVLAGWDTKTEAMEKLAYRRRMQPTWQHRLMERIVTITEQPAGES